MIDQTNGLFNHSLNETHRESGKVTLTITYFISNKICIMLAT